MQTLGGPLEKAGGLTARVTGVPVVTAEAGLSGQGLISVAHGLTEPESEVHFQQPLGVQEENMS